jgi:TetR/AcrR family transcriptional regulator, transcriptional repressor for nem operon
MDAAIRDNKAADSASATSGQRNEAGVRGKGSNSREKVLAAATDLFSTRGFGRTSVDDILRASNVAKSNFYYHFDSKEALGLAVLMRMQEVSKNELWPKTFGNKSLSPFERMEAFVNGIADELERNDCKGGCPFANLATELSDEMPSFREALAKFFQAVVTELAVCVREGQQCRQIRTGLDPDRTAQLVFAQLEGAIMLAKTYKTVSPIRESFRSISALIRA